MKYASITKKHFYLSRNSSKGNTKAIKINIFYSSESILLTFLSCGNVVEQINNIISAKYILFKRPMINFLNTNSFANGSNIFNDLRNQLCNLLTDACVHSYFYLHQYYYSVIEYITI